MKMRYQEARIEDIFKFYVDSYKLKPGEKIFQFKSNYDPTTGEVIFTLFITTGEEEAR